MRRRAVLLHTTMAVALAASLSALMALVAEPAEAAFPGLLDGKIAFVSNRLTPDNPIPPGETSPDFEIFTMNPNGTNIEQLTFNTAEDDFPAWSADGKKIAFTRSVGANEEVYTMDADGDNQINRTNNTATDKLPDWQPVTQIILP